MVAAVDASKEIEEGRRCGGPPFRSGQFIFELLSGASGDHCSDRNTRRAHEDRRTANDSERCIRRAVKYKRSFYKLYGWSDRGGQVTAIP